MFNMVREVTGMSRKYKTRGKYNMERGVEVEERTRRENNNGKKFQDP